jgi:hypothetical protein
MKNLYKLPAIIALIAVIGFAGCDNGNNNNNDDDDKDKDKDKTTAPLLAGKFASQTGTGDAVFFADYASASRSVSRAVAGMSATEKELVGKIEDGDIIFNLSGFHDTVSNQFFLSAGSSFLVYEIGGTLSSSGSMSNAEATVKVKDGNDWKAITIAVSNATDVAITGTASAEQKNGLPVSWYGSWTATIEGQSWGAIITPFQIVVSTIDYSEAVPFVDVKELSATKLEIIWLVEVHYASADSGGPTEGGSEPPPVEVTEWSTFEYMKVWLELTDEGLRMTMFQDSMSDEDEDKGYAYTAAFDTAKALTDEEALKTQYPHYPYEDDSDDPNTINRISVLNFVRP